MYSSNYPLFIVYKLGDDGTTLLIFDVDQDHQYIENATMQLQLPISTSDSNLIHLRMMRNVVTKQSIQAVWRYWIMLHFV